MILVRYIPAVLLCLALCLPVAASAATAKKADMSQHADSKTLDAALANIDNGTTTPDDDMPVTSAADAAAKTLPLPPPKPDFNSLLSDTAGVSKKSGQSATCAPFEAQQLDLRAKVVAYEAVLHEGQLEQARAAADYQRQLESEQLEVRQKLVDYNVTLQEGMKKQAQASTDYQRQLAEEQLRIREELVEYGDSLKPQQDAMRCPPYEKYTTGFGK